MASSATDAARPTWSFTAAADPALEETPITDEVDAWMAAYDNPQKPVVQAVREIILAADARIGETIKWKAPTFVYKGNLASFFPRSKQHASLMFHTGASIEGDFPSLEGGKDTGRFMKFADVKDVKAKTAELRRLVVAWCDQRDGPQRRRAVDR
jgi:hypothetical protein